MKPAISRSRLRNAIVFFAKNTESCGKIKLFKLLYLLDFEHFRQTGKSVTGFDYEAWKFGPVPVKLMQEWEDLEEDLSAAVEIVPVQVIDYFRQEVRVRDEVEFDDGDFTPRQLTIMQNLSERYATTQSPTMIDVTHEQNGAWDKIWDKGRGAQRVIPYELALEADAASRAQILESAAEAKGFSRSIPAGGY
ncbi:type II toxin-antitoxin system antitoxin SocA domain-containing protein [Pseudoduganella umbonata]|uniref:DUF4065 domain-containing protein n=1 Tax=Pseudoduganella umbonata TaxID=864828 RepID=A0A4V1EE93_9BURK|nr:Panacea domain-containing protein [Pseudoduganella umbonata]MBB3223308.1 putative phage-associated protein [Pseudoduganella umbonata]QCP13781.1 DUF4065 domain-containing protein [Pseudoduganella umbonata]